MSQNISDFYRVSQERDFARQFQFRLYQLGTVILNEDDFVYVESAVLPDRAINNVAVPFMGLDFNVPGTAKYPGSAGYQVTFRCDAKYDIRSALEANQIATFDDATSTGNYNIAGPESLIDLRLMNKQNQAIRSYRLYGAYVTNIATANYDIKDAGTVVTIPATLAYHYWRAYKLQ